MQLTKTKLKDQEHLQKTGGYYCPHFEPLHKKGKCKFVPSPLLHSYLSDSFLVSRNVFSQLTTFFYYVISNREGERVKIELKMEKITAHYKNIFLSFSTQNRRFE